MSYIPPIITGGLPIPFSGPHNVGYASFRHSPSNPYTLSAPTFVNKNSVTGKEEKIEALGVRGVEYSVYYPCEKPKGGWFWQRGKQGGSISWLPRPVEFILEGYRRFAGDHPLLKAAAPFLKFTGNRLTAPLYPLAPLLPPTSQSQKRKLVIFSHGLAGTKTAYSAICAGLASEGNIVLAIAHADGSGPGVMLYDQGEGRDVVRLGYLKFPELDWTPERTPGVMSLRSKQLDIRVSEVYETYTSFSKFISSGSTSLPHFHLYKEDGPPPPTHSTELESERAWLDSWRGTVDTNDLTLVGHSFGGGTLLHLLSTRPARGFERLPVRKAVALDPWVDPLPTPGKPGEVDESQPRVPILAINSEGFTLWRTHFDRLSGLIRKTSGSLVSIIGCDHQTFSDFPLLITAPSATKLITTINSLMNSFLHDELSSNPNVEGKQPDKGKYATKNNEKGKQGLDGKWGDVVVHEIGESSKGSSTSRL